MQGARFPHEVLAVVLQVRQGSLHVLLWRRAEPPFEGQWALPGGPLGEDERLGTSLGQHLAAQGRPHRHRPHGATGDPQ